MKKIVGIIPARYSSTRLPGKPLMDICGKPMLWWVYHRVSAIREFSAIYVATDDERIERMCKNHAIPVVMTSSECQTGAHRLFEASEKILADFYVQINGDEPLINVEAVHMAIPAKLPEKGAFGTNIISPISQPAQVMDPSNIKVVFDDEMRALYMSRTPIPYPFKAIDYQYYKHVGIIGYNKEALDFYHQSIPGRLESIEGIDTLRFIDYGMPLQLIIAENCDSLSVDTDKDLELVRKMMEGGKHGV